MTEPARKPALTPNRANLLDAVIPEPASPDAVAAPPRIAGPQRLPAAPAPSEALNTPLNTRIRPSTRERLELAVNKLRYEQSDRTISLASVTDRALDKFLTDVGV